MKQPPVIRLTRQFRFEAAHALWNYEGLCQNIHGHSYMLSVTVTGKPCDNPGDPAYGMVMDFALLKKLINEQIIGAFDHALMLNQDAPYKKQFLEGEPFGKVMLLPYQPTCENMIHDFAQRILKVLPRAVSLHSLKLHETITSFAEWHASDNITS